ncbi:hypothetical protein NQ317_011295, partial [Molorchus minor]
DYLIQNLLLTLGKKKQKSAENLINSVIDQNPQIRIASNSIVLKLGTCNLIDENGENVLTLTPFENSRSSVLDLLQTIGRNSIRQLELPVSKDTRMISPYIKWRHNRDLFLAHFDEQESKQRVRQVFVVYTDVAYDYLQGHVVDGRNLFPAIGYLFMAWETLSLISGLQISLMRVQFENCKFMRATTIPKKGALKFSVSIQKESGSFQITESDALIVSGRIRMMDDSDSDDNPLPSFSMAQSDGPHLTSKDVYKELSLRGYNYKKQFRAIQKYEIEPSRAFIKWEDNWVTFIDNMLQMKILESDTRFLYVPIYIAKLTIDAQTHLGVVSKIPKTENQPIEVPVYSNRAAGLISCGGITVSGLLASSINKRKNMAVPILEKYKFMPNTVAVDIHSSIRIIVQIILENALIYKVKVVELINELTQEGSIPLAPVVQAVIADQPLVQPQAKILSKTPVEVEESIEVEDKRLSSEQDCNIVIVSNIAGKTINLKEAFAPLKEGGYVIAREAPDCEASGDLFPGASILTVHRTPTETLLLLQKQATFEEPLFIKVSSSDNFTWLPTVQEAIKKKTHQNIVLYSESEPLNGILGLVNCIRREPEGKCVKCVFIADEGKKFDQGEVLEELKKGMAINIYKNGRWGSYRHLLLRELDSLQCEHAFVNVTARGDLSSLKWIEGTLRHDMVLPAEKSLVYVHYAALNFRDIMTASGRINSDVITPYRVEQECVQGFEFSGIDSSGKRMAGMITYGALATMVLADPQLCFEIPDSWTLEEAATIPVVYGTVIVGMILRGRIRRNETVLIHSGTGGVGQAAIRLALHYGCRVYTTVGTEEKREFLKKTYPQIKDHHIGNSRDESFEHMILRQTGGRGVDVVLNALAEDKLLASVRCLARGGRFLEIGKFDMANNSYLNTMLFEKEASFHGVMLDHIFTASPTVKRDIMKILKEAIKGGAVRPLNTTVFKYDEVEQAFRYMASGKHMGKVLVQVRKSEKETDALNEIGREFPCVPRYMCDPEKTYVILGGLGGFGLELADWLVLRGAKKLVLTSRKGISTGYQNLRTRYGVTILIARITKDNKDNEDKEQVNRFLNRWTDFLTDLLNSIWRSYGTIVNISKADITTKDGCEELINESLELGSVDAVFNLAVVLADALLEDQTPETFVTSFAPKAVATQYLDEVTRRLCPDLRHFVVFSSMSCGRGNAGQTNYGMANSIMERICERRRNNGYPALAIQWGAVGEVGLVAEMQGENTKLEISGTLQQPISNCLQVLDTLLKQTESEIVSSMVVAEKREHKSASSVVDLVINVLGLNDAKSVSFHATLPELGMDSITAVEIKQALERDFDIFLTPKDFRTMTLARLKEMHEAKAGQAKTENKGPTFLGLEDVIKVVDLDADCCEPYMRLKSNMQQDSSVPKVLLFPGLEGIAKVYDNFAKRLNAETIGMQFMYDCREQSITEMAQSLLPYVEEHLTKDTPFNIVTYSFGTLIALEVVNLLEAQGYIGNLLCIDGAPLLMKAMLKNVTEEIDRVLETAIISHLLTFNVPADIVSKNQILLTYQITQRFDYRRPSLNVPHGKRDCNKEPDILKQHTGRDAVYEKQFTTGIYMRLKAVKEYTPSYSKIRSTVRLFKPTEQALKDVPEDYGLSELFENPVEIHTFDGTHVSILENEELINGIDAYLNGDNPQQR